MIKPLTRRQFAYGMTAASAIPVFGALSSSCATAQQASPLTAASQPFLLRAETISKRLRAEPARKTSLWEFTGEMPGPVLRVLEGTELSLKTENTISLPFSLHWHGVRSLEGQESLRAALLPQATRDLRFLPPDTGTFLYKAFAPGRSSELVDRGLAGVLVVEEKEPPVVDEDLVVAIDDVLLDETEDHVSFNEGSNTAASGRLGNVLLVNGTPAPLVRKVAPGARLRLRLVNLTNARIFALRFDGLKASVLRVDGQPADPFEPVRATLPFAPGSRYDVIVEALSSSGTLTALLGPGAPLLVLAQDPEQTPRPSPLPPLVRIPDNPKLPIAIALEAAVRVDMKIGGGAGLDADGHAVFEGDPARAWTLNGVARMGDPSEPALFTVKRGTPVVVSFLNTTAWPQAMHIQGHCVRRLHGMDDGWEPYWLDTIAVAPGKTARVAFVADNPGRWLMGSTVLERLDTGLAGWFDVE